LAEAIDAQWGDTRAGSAFATTAIIAALQSIATRLADIGLNCVVRQDCVGNGFSHRVGNGLVCEGVVGSGRIGHKRVASGIHGIG
jgi:hypothetical protein